MPLHALAIGHVTHDTYDSQIVAGGCAFYGARCWRALGAEVTLVTAVGEDFACDAALEGLAVTRTVGGATTAFCNTYPPGQPRVQWVSSQAPRLRPSAAASHAEPLPDVTFLAPVFGELDLSEWCARRLGRVCGLGLQGLLKRASPEKRDERGRHAVVRATYPIEPALFKDIDCVFLSEEDVACFGHPGLVDELRRASRRVSLTRGERGALLFDRDRTLEVGVAPAAAIDPTGAGDTYAAALLLGLADGGSVEDSARLAAAAAAVVVGGRGGDRLDAVGQARELMRQVEVRWI